MGIFANLSANRKIIGRLQALEEDAESFRKTSRDLRALDLEFSALYGKVKTALGRIEKRAAIIEADTAPEEEDAGPSLGSPSEGTLTPKQEEWQRRILRERGRSA